MASSLVSLLPPPKRGTLPKVQPFEKSNEVNASVKALSISDKVNILVEKTALARPVVIPPYGSRRNFVPRTIEDFGDGGSFPEIHTAQFPLNMGRKQATYSGGSSSAVVPLTVDSSGNVKYEVLATIGHTKDRIVHCRPEDRMAKVIGEEEYFPRPSLEDIEKETEKTRLSLEKVINAKIASSKPKSIQGQSENDSYIRYIPNSSSSSLVPAEGQNGAIAGSNLNAGERVIRMVAQQIDPLEPAKFKHKKVPRPAGSPPAPVLHSPPRKATAAEQKAWVIPPSISNWKNPKGYTIPLDKRLASDGRGLQEVVVNERFATFAESLYLAENHARKEVETRNRLERQLVEQEKREKEEALRVIAEKTRLDRSAQVPGESYRHSSQEEMDNAFDDEHSTRSHMTMKTEKTALTGITFDSSLEERERVRRERAAEREKEYRMSRMGSSTKQRVSNATVEKERDISERIALGLNVNLGAGQRTAETLFDTRLFHQSAAGISSGYHGGEDEMYDLYDKPLFGGAASAADIMMYRPKRDLNDEDSAEGVDESSAQTLKRVKSFVPDKGFSGKDDQVEHRPGPVEFERGPVSSVELAGSSSRSNKGLDNAAEAHDPFGLDRFLQEAKQGNRSRAK